MRIARRQFIAGSAAVVGAAIVARRSGLFGRTEVERPALAIYDGGNARSRQFAAEARGKGIRTIDAAADPAAFWQQARAGFGLPAGAAVIGVTGWDERVYLAAALGERRMRVRHERKLDGRTFAWRIA